MNDIQGLNQKLVYTLIGFTAVISQVIYIREFMVVFYGNELTIGLVIAIWLLWTAIGSISINKLTKRYKKPNNVLSVYLLFVAVLSPLTIFFIRTCKSFIVNISGEILGIIPIFLISGMILFPICFVLGALFTLAARAYSNEPAKSTGSVYKYEAAGSAVGGVILSLVLVEFLNSFQILFLISFSNFLMFYFLKQSGKSDSKRIIFLSILLMFFALSFYAGNQVHKFTSMKLWQGFNLVETVDTKYGNLAVIDVNGEKSVYENGLKILSGEDIVSREELVHYPLLQHVSPKSVLLIGGGISGSLTEILKHRMVQNIDYVELNPALVEIGKKYFPKGWQVINKDDRIHVHEMDGRLFIKQCNKKYDIIIVNIGDPVNANINRFYTKEFFSEVKSILNNNGILAFQVSGSENYISDELLKFLKILKKTLNSVFENVKMLPGDNIHFFASPGKDAISLDTQLIIDRLKEREITTQFVNENYMFFRMQPSRISELEEQIQPTAQTKINEDFFPVAYFYNILFWQSQFASIHSNWISEINETSFYTFLIVLLIIFFLIVFLLSRRGNVTRTNAESSVFVMGFSVMALELMLILGFQAMFGYIYHQLALLIGVFMAGLAAGTGLSLKQISRNNLNLKKQIILVHVFLALIPLIIFGYFNLDTKSPGLEYLFISENLIFPLFAFVCGGLGGYQFPLAGKMYFGNKKNSEQNFGILYGLDIIGAMIGTLLLSVFMIPLFGFFKVALFILSLNFLIVFSLHFNWSKTTIE